MSEVTRNLTVSIERFEDGTFTLQINERGFHDSNAALEFAFNSIATVYRKKKDEAWDLRMAEEKAHRATLPWYKRWLTV